MVLEIRGPIEVESRFQRGGNNDFSWCTKVQKVYKAAESVQECRKCTKVQKVYKNAESAGLLGDGAALNIILTSIRIHTSYVRGLFLHLF